LALMMYVFSIGAVFSGRSKKLSTIVAAFAICCLWLGMPSNVNGQAPAPETHRRHQHEQALAKKESSQKLSIPDVMLLDQDGNKVRFYTDLIKDKVVVINFIFTSCKIVCPPLGSNFVRIQSVLGERLGKDVHLISISTDPETDTPAQLRAWGAKFGARPGWTLVTGEKAQIDEVVLALIGDIVRKGAHSPIVLIGSDVRGEWVQEYGLRHRLGC
jgi:cytochrome oxidase Cu insertion factor (SCO1/SenC/PrrC family)